MEFSLDDEILLEGSELHKYIAQNIPEYCAGTVFSRVDKLPSEQESTVLIKSMESDFKVDIEKKQLLDVLLNSSLLLEEDAQSLYLLSQTIQITDDKLIFKTLISGASFLLTGLGYLFFKRAHSIFLPLWIGSNLCLIIYSRKLTFRYYFKKNLINLCETVKSSFRLLKNNLNYLHQFVNYVRTKEELIDRELPTCSNDPKYRWARQQISHMSTELLSFLLDSVRFSKASSLKLLAATHDMPSDPHLLLTKSDEQLGLCRVIEQCENGELNLSNLEAIRHLSILMQSEFLRLLGLYLCTSSSSERRIAKVMVAYIDFLGKSLKKLYTFPKIQCFTKRIEDITKKELNNKETVLKSLESLKFSLHKLIADLANIEDYFYSENTSHEELVLFVNSKMESISGGLEEICSYILTVRKMLRKNLTSSEFQTSLKLTDICKTETEPKEIVEVGRSDFRIKAPDEVFLGIPEDENTCSDCGYNTTEDFDSWEPDKILHNNYDDVISEIKVALKFKKEEFEQRELEALKTHPKLQAYLDYQVADAPERDTSSDHPSDNGSNFELQKALSAMVLEKSLQFHLLEKEETHFES